MANILGKRPKGNRNLMKFEIKWDIIRHAYANAHILLSQKHGVLKPPAMSEVFSRMQAQIIREGLEEYCVSANSQVQTRRTERSVAGERKQLGGGGNREADKIFVSWGRILMLSGERAEGLNGNWWGWEKGKKTWQGVKAEIGMEKVRVTLITSLLFHNV